ncbi:hypothetical protein [Sphingobacterium sp.]|uniref:hypothetical protein n=1 Tax=Sphingobacterium sp. TaxID=341027 RepID=UPI00289DBC95|nr:hypothetical protein [Sphingobacterium sp.]
MRNLTELAYYHLFIFLFMLAAVWSANMVWSKAAIPFVQIVIIALLYMLYSYAIAVLLLGHWKGNARQKLLIVGLYTFVSLTVIPVIDALIYKLLPAVGIRFSRHAQSANLHRFYFNIISGYLVANLLALTVFLKYRTVLLKKENDALNTDLLQFRERALGMQYTSHFLTTIFLSNFGKMLIDEKPKDKRTKRDIIQFLAYLLEIEQSGRLNSIDDELDQLNCFVRLLQGYYGERAICCHLAVEGTAYPAIPTGILFFPLENCLKHGLISSDYPVEFSLVGDATEINLSCKNYWAPKHDTVRSETGFSLLKAKLNQLKYRNSLEILQEEATFIVRIKLNFFEVK